MLGKNFILGIPPGIAIIRKGGNRRAFVGIIDPVRKQLANGFEIKGPPSVGYRIVEYGPFSIFAGSSAAIDVKVILDGKVLDETRLLPFMGVAGRFLNQGQDKTLQVGRCNATGHILSFMENDQNKPFTFAPHDASLTADQIADEQIHAGRFSPATFTRPVVGDQEQHQEEIQSEALVVDETAFECEELERAELAQSLVPVLQGLLEARQLASQNDAVPETAEVVEALSSDEEPSDEAPMLALDREARVTDDIPEWAPSHGLVAVGIRFVQVREANEPEPPPDTYQYVLFQLNPFRLSAKVYAKRMKDVELPPKRNVKEIISSWSDVINERGTLTDTSVCAQSKFRHDSLASKIEKDDGHGH